MSIRLPQNPGIGGLDELTDEEELFIMNLLADLGVGENYIIGNGVERITVGTSQPGSPSVGDLWVDTN